MATESTMPPILIIENSPAVRHSLEWLLTGEGYAVATAVNGADALRKLRLGLRPCLILMDLEMPVMDGFQFREAQLKDPRLADIPVVVCSALMDPKELATRITATAHLGKLFDLGSLLGLVAEHCMKQRVKRLNKPVRKESTNGGSQSASSQHTK